MFSPPLGCSRPNGRGSFLADVKTDLDKADAALGLSRRAVELQPMAAGPRLVAARALDRLGKREEARKVAEIGLALAKNDTERQRGQSFLAYLKDATAQSASVDDLNASAQACNSGDAAACAKLAPHLEKKCGEGDGPACGFVAWLHESGKGVAADPAAAITLYQMACDRGEKRGCVRQASLQARGSGVPKDEPKAKARLEALCDGGTSEACTELAILHGTKRTQQDLARTKALLKKACEGGDTRACQLQGTLPK